MLVHFDNSYADNLNGFYTPCNSEFYPAVSLIKFNHSLATQLGFKLNGSNENELANIFSGNQMLEGSTPIAQVYAGHQFGNFVPQLGDGRALLLGEVINEQGKRFDIQLKGSGRTPYSRNGDGKSALGPVLREYIMCEAMHALGIPTTRALAAVTTGEQVVRDEPLPGGVFTRVASSHIRVGTFQYFAAQQELDQVKKLADYSIARHYPHLQETDDPYLAFFTEVCEAQASLVAQWMLAGFIHGVMNTDNMTISGETIDYGPCAFMDNYSPNTVFSSIDRHGRYAYCNQPSIAQWNLARLAEAMLSLFGEDTDVTIPIVTEILERFPEHYTQHWLDGMRKKLGLQSEEENDLDLVNELLAVMHQQKVDYTLLFRQLADILHQDDAVYTLFKDASAIQAWVKQWLDRIARDSNDVEQSFTQMNQVNPIYIPRNHLVEEAINAGVNSEDFSKLETLIEVTSKPFDLQTNKERYTSPADAEFNNTYKTFCGT